MKYKDFKDIGLFEKYNLIDYLYNHVNNFEKMGWNYDIQDTSQDIYISNYEFKIIPEFPVKISKDYSFFYTKEDIVQKNWSLIYNNKKIVNKENINNIVFKINELFNKK